MIRASGSSGRSSAVAHDPGIGLVQHRQIVGIAVSPDLRARSGAKVITPSANAVGPADQRHAPRGQPAEVDRPPAMSAADREGHMLRSRAGPRRPICSARPATRRCRAPGSGAAGGHAGRPTDRPCARPRSNSSAICAPDAPGPNHQHRPVRQLAGVAVGGGMDLHDPRTVRHDARASGFLERPGRGNDIARFDRAAEVSTTKPRRHRDCGGTAVTSTPQRTGAAILRA